MSNETPGLESSIPANNQKIIELYNKMRIKQIRVNTDYQRKLVWKKAHKFNFIDTILRNYPFPEVYFAPGSLDQVELILIDEIVDGQQRLTTIKDYIEETDVFSLSKIPIKKFSELSSDEKSKFLNYEVSVRYLKNASATQVREIFQRINKTDYALNAAERLNAQWGDSEFVCFSKQMVEKDFDSNNLVYKLENNERDIFLEFFHGSADDEGVFTENDISRMLALQYVMSIVATLENKEYFSRADKIHEYIEKYNEMFYNADEIKDLLLSVVLFIRGLNISRASVWFNKANLFSLIVEMSKVDLNMIFPEKLSDLLCDLEKKYQMELLGVGDNNLNPQENKYFVLAREAVNEKSSRDYRGVFISKLLEASKKQ